MKDFQLLKVSQNLYIAIGLSSRRPDDYLCEIESTLNEENFEGTVLLDLLLANGFSRRFFSIDVSVGSRNLGKLRYAGKGFTSPISDEFFLRNPDLLKKGVLTTNQARAFVMDHAEGI